MASQLPVPGGRKGKNEPVLVLPPPLVIPPEQPPSAELEAGVEGFFSPDGLLQKPSGEPSATSVKTPPGLPPPPSLRRIHRRCCGSSSTSDPKDKRRGWQQYKRCIGSVLECSFCLFAAGVAILIGYWSLYPFCTNCHALSVWSISSSSSSAVETAALGSAEESVRPFSTLRINQLQVLGTHNSYHRRTKIPMFRDMFPYDYSSIASQLDAGVRHLELDVHYDWKTGRWFVFHISVVDPVSSCHCLLTCLDEIRVWSDLNPMHHIIFMDIELKLTGDFFRLCGHHTPGQDRAAFQSLQNTILEAFPPERILTPRMVQGDYRTVFEAVNAGGSCVGGTCGSNVSSSVSGEETVGAVPGMAGGWPLVDDTRGMFVFVMDYQTVNLRCRDGFRKALPINETVFFERIPLLEVKKKPPYGAFTQLCQCSEDWNQRTGGRVRKGFIVRQKPEPITWVVPGVDGLTTPYAVTGDETYLARTAAQLLVSNDLVRGAKKGVCRSRCTQLVPEEECVLEGFC